MRGRKPTRREMAARLLTDTDIDGILAEGPPICDICGEFEDQDPTNGREYNWNGETGNHLSCEKMLTDRLGSDRL